MCTCRPITLPRHPICKVTLNAPPNLNADLSLGKTPNPQNPIAFSPIPIHSPAESMKNQGDEQEDGSPPPVAPTCPPAADVENQTPSQARTAGTGFGVAGILRRWKREDLLRRGSLALRGLALVFSLLAFIIMASNKHGYGKNFDEYEEYRYVLAIAILATLYTGAQAFRHAHELSTGTEMFQRRTSALADFIGDQIMAYLLISSSSSAIPLTNSMRNYQDNLFTDAAASAISMAFLAFVALAISALISGHKLSTQSYI